MKVVQLFTDGACSGNPGPGGWAALLRFNSTEKLISGGLKQTTNNQMELQAVISGLQALKELCRVQIFTDSKYVMDGFEKKWVEKWKKNGWQNAKKEPVKNQEFWMDLEAALAGHVIEWNWVKGHSGHRENEIVDEEARRQSQEYINLS